MNTSLVSAASLPSMHDEDDLASNLRGKQIIKMTKKQVDNHSAVHIVLLDSTQTLIFNQTL